MDFFELIARRESCRSYDPNRPVEPEKLRRMVEAAHIAPSACNSQPWKFLVVTDPEKKAQAVKCLQSLGMNRFASDAPAVIFIVEQPTMLSSKVVQRFKNQDFAQMDIGIATAHLALAATQQGLSTCIIGWLSQEKLKNLFGLSENEHVRLALTVGYAANDTLREKNRKPLDDIAEYI